MLLGAADALHLRHVQDSHPPRISRVDSADPVDHPCRREALAHAGGARGAERGAQRGLCLQLPQPACQLGDVPDRRQVPGLAVVDDRTGAARVCRYHGHSCCECLDRDHRRALVRRCEQEGIERPVPGADVVDVAEDANPLTDAELLCQLLDGRPELSVTGQHQHASRHELGGAHEIERALDLRQAAGPADHERVVADVQFGTLDRAGRCSWSDTLVEIEAVVDHRNLRRGRDAKANEIVTDLVADRDDAIGAARERTFDRSEHALAPVVEIAGEHVTVKRVHDGRRAGPAGHERCEASRRAGLRGVRVQHIGAAPPQEAS